MALEETRFTIMALPQSVDASGVLSLNIVFIPRNISPLDEMNSTYGVGGKAKPFVKVQPQFEIKIVNNPDEFPGKVLADEKVVPPISPFIYSSIAENIYTTLRDAKDGGGNPKYFDIDKNRSSDFPAVDAKHKAPKATANRDLAVRKYLPHSYRDAFNFTSPRIKNAVTDDSYHCTLRDQVVPPPLPKDNKVSWGKVYAHLMRQPLMAKKAGLIYKTTIQLTNNDFKKGGWIYVDIKNGTDYFAEQNASLPDFGKGPFIKRYGARIPILKKNEVRSLFAAVLFPVMKPLESPTGIYDELYIEAARFNEGFATIVHANQPVSHNLLKEEQDGFHPQKESGIRLGWEDEQILIWYLRQMAVGENSTERLDAPLGVTGYQVDMKKTSAGDNEWESLTAARSNGSLDLEGTDLGEYDGELPYQVYPTKLYDGNFKADNYWLPMYFANWNNTSIVLPDKTAARIYQSEAEKNTPVKVSDTYLPIETKTKLEYGNEYNFRVRLSDISGGTPAPSTPTLSDFSVSHIGRTYFKRYVAPHAVIITNEAEIISNTDDHNFNGSSLKLSRPVLGYPAVVYTGKYSDVINKLAKSVQDLLSEQQTSGGTAGAKAYGIPDPNVVSVEIKVEIETLQMDNLASEDGREHYITLYKTNRDFVAFNENAAGGDIDVPITFKDVHVLNLTNTSSPFFLSADNDFISQTTGKIILPTARNIRITLRAVGEEKLNYWGHENANPNLASRFGKTTVISMRQESANEKNIFTDPGNPKTLQGIYLQPDPIKVKLDPVFFKTLQGGNEDMPDIVHRLAGQLDVVAKELTLTSENGGRLQFWCSSMLRHSLAPDNSSITFANKNELHDHWLVCTTLFIDRDWSWDSLDASSFHIKRKRKMGGDAGTLAAKSYEFIGDLELKKTASFQAIQKGKDGLIHREYTKIVLIDVVDIKPAEGDSPDTIELQYSVKAQFRKDHAPVADAAFETKPIILPTTINPTQTPKLIAAGVALSPYNRNKNYSATDVRTRFLWLEFDKAPKDKQDSVFCRVLAYSPDQLISNNHPSLIDIPKEPPLTLNPELIRVVTPDSSYDHSGLEAMQQMEKSIDTDRHFYLLSLPPGLHHESQELFGMFTYEFRYGHTDKIWSTAQGRYGRALRVAGLQHPAPALTCLLNRDENIISVNAPFATAVFNGKNVTASPPHTTIWALLYAQVKQADGLDYRNILLNELELKPAKRKNNEEFRDELMHSLEEKNSIYKKKGLPIVEITPLLLQQNTSQQIAWEKESTRQAYGRWSNKEVDEMLDLYGLPLNSSLSILCVEVFGQITNAFEHIDNFERNKNEYVEKTAVVFNQEIATELRKNIIETQQPTIQKRIDPLKSQLGLYRILRTSPLTEVPFICCTM